tara:strand:+ start:152 stop:811 length:660 start_codon:yes stop_codon:yes gene_type:complete
MSVNFPLKAIENESNIRGSIHSSVIEKIISLLPEHSLITAKKKSLIDTLCASNASINSAFTSGTFNSNYANFHEYLMGNPDFFPEQPFWNFKSYQGDFLSYQANLKVNTIRLKLTFRESDHEDLGGIDSFSMVTKLPVKDFLFTMKPTNRKFGVILIVSGYESGTTVKFDIANQSNFFTGNAYLNNPNYGKHKIWKPYLGHSISGNIDKFEVKDVKLIA